MSIGSISCWLKNIFIINIKNKKIQQLFSGLSNYEKSKQAYTHENHTTERNSGTALKEGKMWYDFRACNFDNAFENCSQRHFCCGYKFNQRLNLHHRFVVPWKTMSCVVAFVLFVLTKNLIWIWLKNFSFFVLENF